ncbi:MAG TPA: heat-inducible transcriptional repressor HrcA [Dehalococcoidia bacterium]|nr:heat-inducible transcriptional repressor HrcA [Dehalococcoidia bacterium]
MLPERRAHLLSLIIGEYIDSAVPVGSETLVRRYELPFSTATIRNEMKRLEDEGFISHPHTSAGRVPSDKGYRYYVETLMQERDLPWEVKQTIRHQFHQAGRDQDEWIQLSASVLARAVENAAVVTMPRSVEARLKRLELVGVQDTSALLVLVLQQARVKQQVLLFPEPIEQDQLTAIANHLNEAFSGHSAAEIGRSGVQLTQLEWHVANAVREIMQAADGSEFTDSYLEGVRAVLRKPEFDTSEKMLNLLEVLERRNLPRLIPATGGVVADGVTVMIGTENREDAMHDYSIVVSPYGVPGSVSGAMAVLGPTRMHYPETISTVRFVAGLMSEMLSTFYDEGPVREQEDGG